MKLIGHYGVYHVFLWRTDGFMRQYEMLHMSLDFLEEEYEYVMFLKFDFPLDISNPDIYRLKKSLELIFAKAPDTFILLTNRREAPVEKESVDEFLYSFSCRYANFKKMVQDFRGPVFSAPHLLFDLTDHILKDTRYFKQILVRQIPLSDEYPVSTANCDVIIPHKGDNAYLNSLLSFLSQLCNLSVYVGLDQDMEQELIRFKQDYSQTDFYSFKPNPVGPYVIRNRLIDQGRNELLFFQDSDDIPCADRFSRIAAEMINTNCQLCGSHEIKLDYYTRTVRAIRYPVDVKNSLQKGGGHSLLHPSSAITRTAFYLCDTLSEERIFGNDTKFLYHSYFKLGSIHNIDDFLYIRKLHPDSLTTAPATKLGSAVRVNLLSRLMTDFALVKSGKLKLENSSLSYQKPPFSYQMKKI